MSEEGSMRRRHLLSPAPLPDDDDLLREIFLRLPPGPSTLPRTSLVCKRWGRLVSDPQFLRRFRAFHGLRPHPPLLGFFSSEGREGVANFTPTLDPPDRIDPSRLSLSLQSPRRGEVYEFLGCRHGLSLTRNLKRPEIILWDPIARDHRRVAVPLAWFNNEDLDIRNAALLCDDHHTGQLPLEGFKVILLRSDDVPRDADPHVFASLYESSTGVWNDLISTSITAPLSMLSPSVLVANSFYWFLNGCGNCGILVFDLATRNIAQIDIPVDAHIATDSCFQILRLENGVLGLAILSGVIMQLWERNASSNGGVRWMLQKTIELDKLLSLGSRNHQPWTVIHGYDEDSHAIFVSIDQEVFMIPLKSLQFRHLFNTDIMTTYHPYTGFYTTGRGTGSGDVESYNLNNT